MPSAPEEFGDIPESGPMPQTATLSVGAEVPAAAGKIGRLRAQLGAIRQIIRLAPHDTSTNAGRSAERHRRAAMTALTAGCNKVISVGVLLITVPLTVGYLGQEQYGLWMAISALVSMMGFLDLGIGNGLISAISEANGKDDRESARRYVSAAAFALVTICVLLLLVLWLVYPHVPWKWVLNVKSSEVARDGAQAAAVLIVCFALSVPLSISQRVQLGYQEGFRNNLWAAVGTVLTLVGVLAAIWCRAGLPWLVGAVAAPPLVSLLVNGVELFGFHRAWLRPRLSLVNRPALRRILRLGMLFFVLQLSLTIGYQSDNIVINSVLGPKFVTDYAVPFRLFGFTVTILSMIAGPLWPAYGEAAARGDVAWIRRTLRRSLMLACCVSVPVALLLVIFGKPIVVLWVNGKVVPSMMLLVGLGLWSVVVSVSVAMAMFLNGMNIVRFQVICSSTMAVINIALSIYLARHIGVSGVAYGTVVAQTCCILIPALIAVPSILRKVGERAALPAVTGGEPIAG